MSREGGTGEAMLRRAAATNPKYPHPTVMRHAVRSPEFLEQAEKNSISCKISQVLNTGKWISTL